MLLTLQRFISIALIGIILMSCKKDRVAPPVPVNEIIESLPHIIKPVTERINDVIGGYYSGLPFNYHLTTKNYPLIIFLPGAGQFGNGRLDLPLLLNDGMAQMMDEKKFPSNININGKNFSFIVLTPQFSRYPSNPEVMSFIEFAKKTFRVDVSRIYLSGLSMGGFVTTDVGAEHPSEFAAIVPIAGAVSNGDAETKCAKIAGTNLPVWVFHNVGDPSISVESTKLFVSLIQKFNPSVAPKLTLFPVFGHDAWTRALDPSYKENNMNVYEWMLQYSR